MKVDFAVVHVGTPLYVAIKLGLAEIAEILLNNGADPNKKSLDIGVPPLWYSVFIGDATMVKLLLSHMKTYSQFKEAIDSKTNGYKSIYLTCMQRNRFEIINQLISKSDSFNSSNKTTEKLFDIYEIDDETGNNALHFACESSSMSLCKLLIEKFHFLDKSDDNTNNSNVDDVDGKISVETDAETKNDGNSDNNNSNDNNNNNNNKYIINAVNKEGESAMYIMSRQKNFKLVEYLYEVSNGRCDLSIRQGNAGFSLVSRASGLNDSELLLWLIDKIGNDTFIKEYLNDALKESNGESSNITPLMLACMKGCPKTGAILCDKYFKEVKIETIRDQKNNCLLNTTAYYGYVNMMKLLIRTLFKKHNIHDWQSLVDSKITILDKIDTYIQCGKNNKTHGDHMVYFLTKIKNECIKFKNYELLELLINDESTDANKRQIRLKFENYAKMNHIIDILSKYSTNTSMMNEFCDILIKMIDNKQVINDTLFVLLNKYLPDKLEDSLIHGVDDSMTNGNSYDVAWYKECVLNSLILCKNNLFSKINKKSIVPQLTKQQIFIKNKIEQMKKEDLDNWNKLIHLKSYVASGGNYITQLYYDEKSRIKVAYNENELISDPINNFDGSFEFDNSGYLTKLLIAAKKMNYQFQKDCKKVFNEKVMGIPCVFREAPVKTKDRCQLKGKLVIKLFVNYLFFPSCSVF